MASAVPKDHATVQILMLRAPESIALDDVQSQAGRKWSSILDFIEKSAGFERLYWGRGLENKTAVQLHIVRSLAQFHDTYLTSQLHANVMSQLRSLQMDLVTIRHVKMVNFTQQSPIHAPFTGTAIYLSCIPGLWDAAWNLWTHIVPTVDGCMGIMAGYVDEPVENRPNGYLVYVGWESVKKHDDFHHTEFFRNHWIILNTGNKGWTEYGHVQFQGGRQKQIVSKF